ncbi:MAG: type II secretion system F family protein [Methylophilaceae bacterium]|jgi:tight adherence protein C|nr:type II secretion system F family protein [Methylophilales bacterium]
MNAMNLRELIYLALIFITIFFVAMIILKQLSTLTLQSRLQFIKESDNTSKKQTAITKNNPPTWVSRIIKITGTAANLSLPKEGWENSQLKIRFINAGFRNPKAPIFFFVSKTILTFIMPLLFSIYTSLSDVHFKSNTFLLLIIVFAALGYLLPNFYLNHCTKMRKREIFESFPDAMDLIIVCVEAGLGLDAALARVGEEIHVRSPVLGDELHLINLELRAGSSRERALRNLALRTGVEDIDTLVAMLVQSDRFGTSVADSLRVHAESLRSKRRLIAEETAAKIGVKLLFPLIFFIFPSMLLVLLGPAVISINKVLMPILSAQ